MTSMITFKNLGCLKSGSLEFELNALNIKYGLNGIGKTTIVKGIVAKLAGTLDQNDTLIPFSDPDAKPQITLPGNIKTCEVYNADFVDRIKVEAPFSDSAFEVLVESPEIEEANGAINNFYHTLKDLVFGEAIQSYCKQVNEIVGSIGKQGFSGTKANTRGFKNGAAKVDWSQYPALSGFQNLFEHSKFFDWFKWRESGGAYILDDRCPYCSQKLPTNQQCVETAFQEIGTSKDMQDKSSARRYLQNSLTVLPLDAKSSIDQLAVQTSSPKSGENAFDQFKSLSEKAMDEVHKIEKLRTIVDGKPTFNNPQGIIQSLNELKLEISAINESNADLLKAFVAINDQIDSIISKANEVQAANQRFNKKIAEAINKNETAFNDFLRFAGMPYTFTISRDGSLYSVMLAPVGISDSIEAPKDYLSYGEMNALALVMFAAQCVANKPDLIILDDPISSYDSGKRYLLLNFLFGGSNTFFNLKGKTCLLFTHDFTPVIDVKKLNLPGFQKRKVWYVSSVNHQWQERCIEKKDISLTSQFELAKANDSNAPLPCRLLHMRRHAELSSWGGPNVYDYLSSLIHFRPSPTHEVDCDHEIPFTDEDLKNAESQLKNHFTSLPDNYDALLASFNSMKLLLGAYDCCANRFDKLAVFRMIAIFLEKQRIKDDVFHGKAVFKAVVDDTAHIEHQYVFTIDEVSQDTVPEYVIHLIDSAVSKLRESFEKSATS